MLVHVHFCISVAISTKEAKEAKKAKLIAEFLNLFSSLLSSLPTRRRMSDSIHINLPFIRHLNSCEKLHLSCVRHFSASRHSCLYRRDENIALSDSKIRLPFHGEIVSLRVCQRLELNSQSRQKLRGSELTRFREEARRNVRHHSDGYLFFLSSGSSAWQARSYITCIVREKHSRFMSDREDSE